MNLKEASQKALEIAEKRGIHENTMEALKHCAGEVLEAVESYTRFVYSPKTERTMTLDIKKEGVVWKIPNHSLYIVNEENRSKDSIPPHRRRPAHRFGWSADNTAALRP